MEKIVIVTGASGFLGNNIIRKLSEDKECRIRAMVFPGESIKSLEGQNCKIYYGDVTKPETFGDIFAPEEALPMYIIHCAAIVYIKSRPCERVWNINVGGTANIVKEAERAGARLVYVSSVHSIEEHPGIITETKEFDPDKVFGVYAKTKAEAAGLVLKAVKEEGLDAVIVHPSGLIGPNDHGNSHLTELVRAVSEERIPAVFDGGYNFADVRDVADGIISAMKKGRCGEPYLLTGEYVSLKTLVKYISDSCGVKEVSRVLPLRIVRAAAPICELYYNIRKQTPLFTGYSILTLTSNVDFSSSKAKEELDYRARPLRETVRDTVEWLRGMGSIRGIV